MGADAAQIKKVKLLGIAFCFLAALFFVEAKTAWAGGDQFTPTDIAAAKACDLDRIQIIAVTATPQAAPAKYAIRFAGPEFTQKFALVDTSVERTVLPQPTYCGICYGQAPFALTNRPPPFNS